MAQLLVSDVEPDAVMRLMRRAQRNGRSLQAELRDILERASGEPESAPQEVYCDLDPLYSLVRAGAPLELTREQQDSP